MSQSTTNKNTNTLQSIKEQQRLIRKQYDLIEKLLTRVETLKKKNNNLKKMNNTLTANVKKLENDLEVYSSYCKDIHYVMWK